MIERPCTWVVKVAGSTLAEEGVDAMAAGPNIFMRLCDVTGTVVDRPDRLPDGTGTVSDGKAAATVGGPGGVVTPTGREGLVPGAAREFMIL